MSRTSGSFFEVYYQFDYKNPLCSSRALLVDACKWRPPGRRPIRRFTDDLKVVLQGRYPAGAGPVPKKSRLMHRGQIVLICYSKLNTFKLCHFLMKMLVSLLKQKFKNYNIQKFNHLKFLLSAKVV